MPEAVPILVLVIVVIFLSFFFYMIPVRLWLAAMFAGVHVSFGSLIGMRIRRVSPPVIVNAMIMSHKAGISLSVNDLEAHYLAGGNVYAVVTALISADKANIPL